MDNPLLKAQDYHDQAEKMRGLAASEKHEEYRQALLKLADSYDQISLKLLEIGREAVNANRYEVRAAKGR